MQLRTLFFLLLIQLISFIYSYDFQCLICDNSFDGPGCGDYTREIPVRRCRTFCYFTILSNQRAIRDCSPYDDISIDNHILLQSKINLTSTIEILSLKRCTSEQCNNDFYIQSNEFLLYGRSSSINRSMIYFVIIFSFVIHFLLAIK